MDTVAEFECIPGRTITRERHTASEYGTDGRWVDLPPTVDLLIQGVVHPATSKKSLSEAMIREIDNNRSRKMVVVYSVPDTWMTEDEALGIKADIMVYLGERYEAMMVDEWRSGVLDHDKTLMARLDLRDGD